MSIPPFSSPPTAPATSTRQGKIKLAGDLTGTADAPTLVTSGVSAATYGSSSQIPQIVVDAKGRITSASNISFSALTSDTKANILALSPTLGKLAYATDTYEFYLGDGTSWRKVPFTLQTQSANPDLGSVQSSSKIGYYSDGFTDKLASQLNVGSHVNPTEGLSIRTSSSELQYYVNGTWNNLTYGLRIREDASGAYALEHKPIGFTEWIKIYSGNGVTIGLNGLPLVQQYAASMGAYPYPLRVNCGTF